MWRGADTLPPRSVAYLLDGIRESSEGKEVDSGFYCNEAVEAYEKAGRRQLPV
jgi:hypothetical protein